MPLRVDTLEAQRSLAHICRSGVLVDLSGAAQERLSVYRRLIFNTIESALSSAYPISKRLLGPEKWEELSQGFVAEADSVSPMLWQMPRVLIDYATRGNWSSKLACPFLIDLLSFEWLEIELYMKPDAPVSAYAQDGDVMENHLVMNPDSKVLVLSYPVFRTTDWNELQAESSYAVLGFRHREELHVSFLEVSPFLGELFSALQERPQSGMDVMLRVAGANRIQLDDNVVALVRRFLEAALRQGALLGFKQ